MAVSVTKTLVAGELVESACDSCGVRLLEVAGADRWRAAYCRHRPGILEPDPETCGLTLTLEGSMA